MFALSGSAATRLRRDRDDRVVIALLVGYGLFFLVAVVMPLGAILSRSMQDDAGRFVGLANYASYLAGPGIWRSLANSFFVAGVTTVVVVALAFGYAYALTRSRMRLQGFFKVMAMAPLLAPGLLKAIALVYLFGNQGALKALMAGHSIYGPIGIIIASTLWTLPHAIMLLTAALLLSDARLYEAAESLKAGSFRTFLTVTLPGVRYGLISTAIFVFVRVLTEFGIPKVIGGSYNVLATDIYKEVVGQQNFATGSVVSIILLLPAVLAFVIDRIVSAQQVASLTARSTPYVPKPNARLDWLLFSYCAAIACIMLGVIAMGQYAALIRFWPYNLELTLDHYVFDVQGVGWGNFWNSLILATGVATIGTALTFGSAWLVEKPKRSALARQLIQIVALAPMAIPGLVFGLGYLFVVNQPGSPLNALYGTMALLIVNTTAHYYTVTHLTALTTLKQMDREFEAVASSLKVPIGRSFWKITVPICAPTLLDIWSYLFLNAMTTVSGVIFLYSIDTKVASIAVIHLDEAGDLAAAAAMAMLIVYASATVRVLHFLLGQALLRRFQSWRGTGVA